MIDTNDKNDPRNLPDTPPIAFDKKVTVSLSKEMPLHTTFYEAHLDCDGRGYYTDESDGTDFLDEYKSEHHSIPELLDILAFEAKEHINELVELSQCEVISPDVKTRLNHWIQILHDCQRWSLENIEIDNT